MSSNNAVIVNDIIRPSVNNRNNVIATGPGGFAVPIVATPECEHPPLEAFKDEKEFITYVDKLLQSTFSNSDFLAELLLLKDKVLEYGT